MSTTRRDFLTNMALGTAAVSAAAGPAAFGDDQAAPTRGGVHSVAKEHPYIFIDGCMQMWHDADFASAHRHGVTA
jgi:hypothetical protein